jgi:hypothetical protein
MVERVGESMERLGSVGRYPKSSEPGSQQCIIAKKKGNVMGGVVAGIKKIF